jgi:hypothetical protein
MKGTKTAISQISLDIKDYSSMWLPTNIQQTHENALEKEKMPSSPLFPLQLLTA